MRDLGASCRRQIVCQYRTRLQYDRGKTAGRFGLDPYMARLLPAAGNRSDVCKLQRERSNWWHLSQPVADVSEHFRRHLADKDHRTMEVVRRRRAQYPFRSCLQPLLERKQFRARYRNSQE